MLTVTTRVYVDPSDARNDYPLGQQVTIEAVVTLAGVDYDPDDLTLQQRSPIGTNRTYKYSSTQLTKSSVGHYSRTLILDKAGRWEYRFTATGGVRGTSGDVVINVDPSNFSMV